MRTLKWLGLSSEKSRNFQAIIDLSSYEHIERRSLPKLHKAVLQEKKEKIVSILSNKQCINKKDRLGRSPLHYAAAIASEEIITLLIKETDSIDLESLDEEKKTPLFKAVEKKSPNCTKLLVEYGSSIDIYDKYSEAPVHLASLSNRVEVLETLVQAGGDINLKDSTGSTPLHLSVALGRFDCSVYLLEHGAFVNALDNKGRTPLMLSAIESNASIAKMLLDYGAQSMVRDYSGISALQHATRNRNYEIASLLQTYEGKKRIAKEKTNKCQQYASTHAISYVKEWGTCASQCFVNIGDSSKKHKRRESVLAHEVYCQVPNRTSISVERSWSEGCLISKTKTNQVQTTVSNPNCTLASSTLNPQEKVEQYLSKLRQDVEAHHLEEVKNDDDYFREIDSSGSYENKDLLSGESVVETITADMHDGKEDSLSFSAVSSITVSSSSLHAKLSPLQGNELESDSSEPTYVQSHCTRDDSVNMSLKIGDTYKEENFKTDMIFPRDKALDGQNVNVMDQDKDNEPIRNKTKLIAVNNNHTRFQETPFLKELKTAVQSFQHRREKSLDVPNIQTHESFLDSLDFDEPISSSPNIDTLSVHEYEGDVSANDIIPSKENVLQGQRSIDSDRREPYKISSKDYKKFDDSSSSETLSSKSATALATGTNLAQPSTANKAGNRYLCKTKENFILKEDCSYEVMKYPFPPFTAEDKNINKVSEDISTEVGLKSTFKERSSIINSGPLVGKCINLASCVDTTTSNNASCRSPHPTADAAKSASDIKSSSIINWESEHTLEAEKLTSSSIFMDIHDEHLKSPRMICTSSDSFALSDTFVSDRFEKDKSSIIISREILYSSKSADIPSIVVEDHLFEADESELIPKVLTECTFSPMNRYKDVCDSGATTEVAFYEIANKDDVTRAPQLLHNSSSDSCHVIKYKDFMKNSVNNFSDSDSCLLNGCVGETRRESPNLSSSVKSFDYFSLQEFDKKTTDFGEIPQSLSSDEEEDIYIAYMPSTKGTSERFVGDHTARVSSLAQSASVLRDTILERRVKNVKLLDLLHTRKSDLEELILAMSVPIGKHADKTSESYQVYSREKEKLLSEVNTALKNVTQTIINEFTLADKELSILSNCKSEIDHLDAGVKAENVIILREYRNLMEKASRLNKSMNELHLLAVEGSCLLDASLQDSDRNQDQIGHLNKQIELLKITAEEQDLLENRILQFIDLNRGSSTVLVKKLEDLKLAEDVFLKIANDIC